MSTRQSHAAPLLLLATAAACGRPHQDRASAATREGREQVDSLARVAARLATADTTARDIIAHDSAASDSGARARSPVGRATIPNAVGLPQATGVVAGAATADRGAPDSLRIISTNHAVVYTLVRDTVRMQLGDTVLRELRRKMEAKADSASGNFGSFIARTMAGAVGSAMSFVVKTPVRDIRSARYDNGELKIETSTGPVHGAVNVGDSKDRKEGTTFARADAERFVAAIQARRRALGLE